MHARARVLLSAFAFAILSCSSASAVDARRYCNAEAANVIFYLDVTTPYDDIDKRALVEGIGRIFEGLGGGERLSIRTIEDSFPRSARVLEACVPFCDGGVLGDLFSDCTEGMVIADTKTLRRQIVESLAARLSGTTELPNSEIIRTLALSAGEEFREGQRNVVYIFSDMIENSSYLTGADFFATENQALVTDLADDKLIPNLFGAEVTIFGIGRGGGAERTALPQDRLEKLQDFWRLFFVAAGAEARLSQNFTAPH
jgi:hypothetical protein